MGRDREPCSKKCMRFRVIKRSMSHPPPPPPESPPPSPAAAAITLPGAPSVDCTCGSFPASLSVNNIADSLGVSPLYKQQDSARWTASRHVYMSSKAGSPNETVFPFGDEYRPSAARSPLSLEEIASRNRSLHREGTSPGDLSGPGGPLELEAIAAVHELALEVHDMSVSEMLPRTSDLIFVNMKTQEGRPYTLELTMKGWRVASCNTDCMNGDYTNIDLHVRYYHDARELLNALSPAHAMKFNECVAKKLEVLASQGDQLEQCA